MKSKQWFINRIGKTIYREKVSCNCNDCKKVLKQGFKIIDLNHALTLHLMENELGIKYKDKK